VKKHFKKIIKYYKSIDLSIKSCLGGPKLHPSFDVSSSLRCYLQSHEILLNKGMKYWNSGLNAPSSKKFMVIVYIEATVISWKCSRK
jgi:hypothetical protein